MVAIIVWRGSSLVTKRVRSRQFFSKTKTPHDIAGEFYSFAKLSALLGFLGFLRLLRLLHLLGLLALRWLALLSDLLFLCHNERHPLSFKDWFS